MGLSPLTAYEVHRRKWDKFANIYMKFVNFVNDEKKCIFKIWGYKYFICYFLRRYKWHSTPHIQKLACLYAEHCYTYYSVGIPLKQEY